jgi:dTDP-4-amino-4,6-dideoxygalactose transaminase
MNSYDKAPSLPHELLFFRGRVALYAILKALGVGSGDEVGIQAFTCVAVPEAITASGARPVFIDIEPKGFNLSPSDLVRKITPKTRAIVVQHTYGIPASMDQIIQCACERGIPIIEDCCHSFVSAYKGKTIGNFGVASFYSFEWGKPIVVGIGGSAVINDSTIRDAIRKSYACYKSPSFIRQVKIQAQYIAFRILYRPSFFWQTRMLFHWLSSIRVVEQNYNPIQDDNIAEDFSLRMAPFLQSRLTRKLGEMDQYVRHSRLVSDEYQSKIISTVVAHPELTKDNEIVFARYPLLAKNKQVLLAMARREGVELADWYSSPVHPLSFHQLKLVGYTLGSCPNAEERSSEVVTLPTHSSVGKRDIDRIIDFLNRVVT